MLRKCLVSLFFILFSLNSIYAENFAIEDYGLLPDIRSVSISPDGKHYALIKNSTEGNFFIVIDIAEGKVVGGANAGKFKARSIYFATNKHVILRTSKTRRSSRVKGYWEDTAAYVYNLENKKLYPLLKGAKGLYIAQTGLGRIVGLNQATNEVYMPAYLGSSDLTYYGPSAPSYALMRVNLETGRARRYQRGNRHVTDWFVNERGEVLAREEFDKEEKEHRVFSKTSGDWKVIYTNKTDIPEISVVAISKDDQKLIFSQGSDGYGAIYSMTLSDGTVEGPLFKEEGSDIDAILTDDLNRKFTGVLYSGLLPFYEYRDETIQENLAAIQGLYPRSEIRPLSMSADKNNILVRISGNDGAQVYSIFNATERKIKHIGSGYPGIKKDQIAQVKAIRYKTRDGLSLTAILTHPVGVTDVENLPMIVMPHGGPESYDSINFDWWAQFLARKGYLVLQPNFRGSSGFGYEFSKAGYGKWGQEMQDDVTDGVKAMIKAGYSDPKKVCIVGASYGGYSALAGGAFTPELYRCVVSFAGVSDLPMMLTSEARHHGRNHWVVSYWNKVIGNSKTEREKLKAISPVNSATTFKAPLLLVHGKKDTVVPINQSKRMYKAMKNAGKEVEMITLKGEDHWLSNSETRLALLKEISDFLDKHNPTEVN